MKRKSSQNIPIKTYKRKETISCYSGTTEKDHSIYDYFSLMQPKGIKKPTDKPLAIIQDISKRKFPCTKYILVKNPSKHQITTTECSFPEAKYSNIITEDKITGLILSFERVIAEFKSAFVLNNFGPYYFKKEDFSSFVNENLTNILIKYLLQLDDNLLFIPKRFIQSINDKSSLSLISSPVNNSEKEKEKDKEREMAKLISGFDDSKNLALKYSPINITEAKNTSRDLCETLIDYLNYFNNQGKEIKDSKKALQKALVIYNPEDYLQYIKLIEIICNDIGYETIRIDELEMQKVAKIKTLSEATKSQRLSSLSEDVIYKMNIIESIVNFHKAKWQNLTQINDENNNLAIAETTIDSSENNSTQSNNDPAFIKYQQTVHEIFFSKKTMLFLVDSFKGGDEDKSYIANIISRIPTTKCPIVLLTNNLGLLTSSQSTMKHFVFYHWNHKENINNSNSHLNTNKEHYVIYLASLVIFIHLYFFNVKETLTKEEKSKTFYDSFLIKELNEILMNDVLRIKMINDKICYRIIKVAIFVSLKHHFCIDEILFEYSRLLRSISLKYSLSIMTNDKNELLKSIESQLYCFDNNNNDNLISNISSNNYNDIIYEDDDDDLIEEDHNEDNNSETSFRNINDNLVPEMNELDELSYNDSRLGIINKIANKSYKYKSKYKTYDKEDINIEDIILNQTLKLNNRNSNISNKCCSKYSLMNVYNDNHFKQIALEDKRFYSNTFTSTTMPFLTFKSLPFYYHQMKYLNSVFSNTNTKVSRSKMINSQFNCNSTNTMTNNKKKSKSLQKQAKSILGKVFGRANEKQISRYLQVHDYNHMVINFKQNYFANCNKESIGCYYRNVKLIDKLKLNMLASSIRINDESCNDFSLLKPSTSYSKERTQTHI